MVDVRCEKKARQEHTEVVFIDGHEVLVKEIDDHVVAYCKCGAGTTRETLIEAEYRIHEQHVRTNSI